MSAVTMLHHFAGIRWCMTGLFREIKNYPVKVAGYPLVAPLDRKENKRTRFGCVGYEVLD